MHRPEAKRRFPRSFHAARSIAGTGSPPKVALLALRVRSLMRRRGCGVLGVDEYRPAGASRRQPSRNAGRDIRCVPASQLSVNNSDFFRMPFHAADQASCAPRTVRPSQPTLACCTSIFVSAPISSPGWGLSFKDAVASCHPRPTRSWMSGFTNATSGKR